MLHRIEERTPEWYAMRLKYVGGSEISGLWGVQPEFGQSQFTLHMVKSGRIPAPDVDDSPGSRIWFGIQLEPVIARMAAGLYQWDIEKAGYYTDDTTPGMGASLDFVIKQPGPAEKELGFTGPGALQIKNTAWLNWAREWVNGEPPQWILLQLQHEIACAGFTWGAIVVMVDGNTLPVYRYAARPRIIEGIREKVTDFWTAVREGNPPQTDASSSTADALRALYPSVPTPEPLDMRGHNRFPDLAAQFIVARENKRESERRYDDAKNEMEALLEGATWAESDEFKVHVAVVKESLPRAPKPGEMIGGRKSSRRITVSENLRK